MLLVVSKHLLEELVEQEAENTDQFYIIDNHVTNGIL
jgi:hypothetical protein